MQQSDYQDEVVSTTRSLPLLVTDGEQTFGTLDADIPAELPTTTRLILDGSSIVPPVTAPPPPTTTGGECSCLAGNAADSAGARRGPSVVLRSATCDATAVGSLVPHAMQNF